MLDVLDWIVRSALRWFSHRDNRFRAVGRVVLGITTLSLCLSGCAMSVPFSTQDRQIIVMWHAFTGSNARALQTLTDRFNAENSWNIVLVTEYQEQLLDKLLADPDSRPDLVTLWPEELQTYVALGIAGAAPTLSPEMQVAWDDVLPMARALYEVDGQAKALPLGLATYLAYYNEEWLSELGYDATTATWEDFRRTV